MAKKPKKEESREDRVQTVLDLFDDAVAYDNVNKGRKAADTFAKALELARAIWPADADALADDVDLVLWRANHAATLQGMSAWDAMYDVMKECMAGYPPDRPTDERSECDVLTIWAIALQHTRRLDEALAAIDKAIALDGEDADAHHERACILAWKGDRRGALDAMKRAIEIDPNRLEALREDTDFEDLHDNAEFKRLVGITEKVDAL